MSRKILSSNRENMNDYIAALDTLLFSFVKTEEFITLSAKARNTLVDCVIELKELAISSLAEKDDPDEKEAA